MGAYDVAVIGAGHAGCEAALASARLGLRTALFTISLDSIANMPCNPSVGGTAKGHLVREIDALGGEMGRAADAAAIQSRMLNRSKGAAVRSLRVQADRRLYHVIMKKTLEAQENLDLKQAEVVGLETENGNVKALITKLGAVYGAKAAIIASGTYLQAKIYVGDAVYRSGPDGNLSADMLSENLKKNGVSLRRFKTGTPARVHRRSVDFSRLAAQEGDAKPVPFSFETTSPVRNLVPCHIAYTNASTHKIIMDNLRRSPLYGGRIEGVGPRYCPSIEDKVVRFAEKERHQLFIEPMGLDTEEMYLQGMSSSLPEDVQLEFYRSIEGLENVEIMRSAYAIEYDCCDPTQLFPTLEFKSVGGLYGAGQFNGTSGYEEAAAQGLVAGINAALKIKNKEALVLSRSNSYIGALIDDLVTKGCSEPYRMMTSRSEYRLFLRQDNADQRLTPLGHAIGLISRRRFSAFLAKLAAIEQELAEISKISVQPSEALNKILEERNSSPISASLKFSELLRRPQLTYSDLAPLAGRPALPDEISEQVEITVKYKGYLERQLEQIARMQLSESRLIPPDINYSEITGLRLEAKEKLDKIRPLNLGQASRISGVSPADVSVLLVFLKQRGYY